MMAMLIDVNNIVEVSKKWKFMVILGGLKKNRYPGGPGTSQDDVVFLNGNFMDDIRTCTCFDHVFNLFVCISYIYIHTRSHTVSLSLFLSLSVSLSLFLSTAYTHICVYIYIYTHETTIKKPISCGTRKSLNMLRIMALNSSVSGGFHSYGGTQARWRVYRQIPI